MIDYSNMFLNSATPKRRQKHLNCLKFFLYFKTLFQVNTGTEASAMLSQIIIETVVGFIKHSSTLDKYRNML